MFDVYSQSFIHVSTAYANCPQSVIEEKFYDPPMDSDKLIALMECIEDKLAEDITPQYVNFFLPPSPLPSSSPASDARAVS